MEKISCDVIQDILPLYIDGAVSNDTKMLVEEHLQSCESCRRLYHEIQKELLFPVEMEKEGQEIKELQSFKKFLSKKKLQTALLSVAGAILLLAGLIVFMNRCMLPVRYEDTGITIYEEDQNAVYYKTNIRGNYHWKAVLDRETGICTIYFEQSLWERYVDCLFYPFDHIHCILKKDEIKQIYLDPDGTENTVWEASEEEKETYFLQDKQPLG